MTSRQIRQQFLDFFASKGHAFVLSSPVVPHDDPTLMFANAGMNQFKPIFLGTARAEHARVANSQKCIRAGGKHNDLDDVGQDTYHHTFFEMLGNWSFGDYFKKEAIGWAWELLTKVWGIDKTRLHATYFGGQRRATEPRSHEATEEEGTKARRHEGTKDGEWELAPDYESRDLWISVTDIDPSHVHPGSMKDNFWEMGDTGPCGPCSEIHIDLTPDGSGRDLVNKGDARVMELWNLVFIQFNRGGDGKLTPLPAKHVDTGMGFERLCAVLLKKTSNYDTDVFTPIFEAIRKRTGAAEYRGTLPSDEANRHEGTEARRHEGGETGNRQLGIDNSQVLVDVSYRVIADHLRCLVFALTDGAIPSNDGRGYVLRRILRRAVRYGRQYLNMHEPFLCDLVPTVVEHMGSIFPELRSAHGGKNIKHVSELIRDEEASFIKTLDRGIKLFTEAAEYARRNHHGKISGEDAFKLHDTYGFPIDLTELMAEEEGMTIDIGEYERLMEEAKTKARTSLGSAGFRFSADRVGAWRHVGDWPATDDTPKYDHDELLTYITHAVEFRPPDGFPEPVPGLMNKGDDHCALVLDSSCFYHEQGGQVGDCGIIESPTGIFEVVEIAKGWELIFHTGRLISGSLAAGQQVLAKVNPTRKATRKNHTSTHILNWALREVLGDHVQQKGSLVDPEKTRFDFSHNHQLTEDEVSRIERLVKEQIDKEYEVLDKVDGVREVDQKAAREINTLRAVFGEKYPDKVRVVSIGADIKEMLRDPKNPKWMKHSVEFCGGTHLKNSKEAEEFVLVHEEAVAKGVRRLVGVTAEKAKEAIRRGEQLLEIAEALRTGRTPPLPPLGKGGIEGGVGPQSGLYDLARLLKEIAEVQIPILARHRLAGGIAALQEAAKEHQKKSEAQAQRGAVEAVADLLANKALDVAGITVLVGEVPGGNADALRSGIDYVRNKKGSSGVLLATVDDGKVTLVAGISKDLVERGIKAGDLIKEICPLVGGKGGGRPDMAQGGGTDPKGLPRALDRAKEWLSQKLS